MAYLVRSAFIVAAVALFAACGGFRTSNPAVRAETSASHATSEDLLYVSNPEKVFVYNYPGGQLFETLSGHIAQYGICSDAKGNIFTAYADDSYLSSTIYEYAPGGTTPIATLTDPGLAFGCAVDQTTGDLAVANWRDFHKTYDSGDVAIFRRATGTPTIFFNANFFSPRFCGYDNHGNLFVSTFIRGNPAYPVLVSLSKGTGGFNQIDFGTKLQWSGGFFPSVEWDGNYITVSNVIYDRAPHRGTAQIAIYRLQVSGTRGTVVGTTMLTIPKNGHLGQVWIRDGTVVAPYTDKGQRVGFWAYPQGGSPQSSISVTKHAYRLIGLTVSVPPSGE